MGGEAGVPRGFRGWKAPPNKEEAESPRGKLPARGVLGLKPRSETSKNINRP